MGNAELRVLSHRRRRHTSVGEEGRSGLSSLRQVLKAVWRLQDRGDGAGGLVLRALRWLSPSRAPDFTCASIRFKCKKDPMLREEVPSEKAQKTGAGRAQHGRCEVACVVVTLPRPRSRAHPSRALRGCRRTAILSTALPANSWNHTAESGTQTSGSWKQTGGCGAAIPGPAPEAVGLRAAVWVRFEAQRFSLSTEHSQVAFWGL